ncbi:MAG: NAD(P)H-hydrate epimerase [Planctomycetaceae bacterium]
MANADAALTRDQVREIDRRAVDEYGMTSLVLMENAGRGAADLLLQLRGTGPVCICCGKGNNGGDGFVIARHLEAAGVDVHVLLFADPDSLAGDPAANRAILQKASTPLTVITGSMDETARRTLTRAEWIVDALLGTGVQGTVREPYARVIEEINRAAGCVLAVDLPSGLDCDMGRPFGTCVHAAHTATFVARKSGFDRDDAEHWTGPVTVVPIGVPRQLLAAYNL